MEDKFSEQLLVKIGSLEGKMDLALKNITELNASFHELEQGRLSKLELQFSNLTGKLAIISAVVSIIISIGFIVLQKYIA